MTIRILGQRGDYPANSLLTLDSVTETALVASGQASSNLAGGVVWTPPGNSPGGWVEAFTASQAAGMAPVATVGGSVATASANRAAIQAALDAGGRVTLYAPPSTPTIYIDRDLTINDGNELIVLGNTELRMSAAAGKCMLKTYAHAVRTDVSVTVTWASGLSFNVAWTAHGLAVNDCLGISGTLIGSGTAVGDRIFNGAFRVDVVVDANNVTCSVDRLPTSTTIGGTHVARKLTTDFKIIGGVWNYDRTNNTGGSGIDLMGLNLGYAARFEVQSIRPKSSTKYGLYVFCAGWFSIRNLTNNNDLSDGFKIFGPAKHFEIDGVSGVSADDFGSVQCNAAAAYAAYTLTTGDVYGGKIKNIRGRATSTGSLFVCYTWAGYYMDDIVVDGVSGSAFAQLCHITTDAGSSGGNFETITFKNFAGGPTYGFRALNQASGGTLILEGVTHAPGGITTLPAFNIGADVTLAKFVVNGITCTSAGWLPGSAAYVGQVTGTVSDVAVNDARIALNNINSRGFQFNGTNLKRAVFNRLTMISGGGANIVDSSATGTPKFRFNDAVVLGGAACALISPTAACSVHIDGGDFNTVSNGLVRPNGAFAVSLRVTGAPKRTSAPLWAVFGGATPTLDAGDNIVQALTPGATPAVDCSLGNIMTLAIGANATATLAAPSSVPPAGTLVSIQCTQDATGGRTLALNAAYLNSGVLSNTGNTANKVTMLNFISNGTALTLMAANTWY
jgi:hypothetical protein